MLIVNWRDNVQLIYGVHNDARHHRFVHLALAVHGPGVEQFVEALDEAAA